MGSVRNRVSIPVLRRSVQNQVAAWGNIAQEDENMDHQQVLPQVHDPGGQQSNDLLIEGPGVDHVIEHLDPQTEHQEQEQVPSTGPGLGNPQFPTSLI